MRWAALLVVFAGCDFFSNDGPEDQPHPHPDAAGLAIDANHSTCTAANGTANVSITNTAPPGTFTRLDAGGVIESGPVTGGFAGIPMQFQLLVLNLDPLPGQAIGCCESHDTTCCTVDGVYIRSMSIPAGAEIGTHPVMVDRFDGTTLNLDATLTITQFSSPVDHAPGRIAGSIATPTGGTRVSGTFDNAFCSLMLSATI